MRFLLSVLFSVVATLSFGQCAPDRVDVRGDWGRAAFTVEVAQTADQRAQGLMHRESMPKSSGMLFVYEYPQRVAFWMRNTLIPLDMIFADSRGVVQKVHSNAIPGDETSIPGGGNIQYVLEINGGMASLFGIDVGSELRHPKIVEKSAAWPCQ